MKKGRKYIKVRVSGREISNKAQGKDIPKATGSQPMESALLQPRVVDIGPEVNELLLGTMIEYRRVVLKDLWDKSLVSNIYLHERVAYRIEQFVFNENKEMHELRGRIVPEIGGWLLGRYRYVEAKGCYLVSFEHFINIQRKDNSDTRFTFDANAWQVLEKAKDVYKDEGLETVGWFHTHPGWGVFLSAEDINTHETYFTEPYHVAMELESINSPYEVGFFTRYKDSGRLMLNNRAPDYYKWEDFRNWLRGK